MISIRFTKAYGERPLDIRFEAPSRGITALFGRSGAGKSSILGAVAGALAPDTGRIIIGDRTFVDTAAGVFMPPHARRVGFVFQDSRLFPHLTVAANLRYGEKRAPGPHRIAHDDVVALLGIADLLARRPHTLSGGERQRVAIGRALLAQPELMLMDEPLASLDPPRKAELLPYIERLRDHFGLPILYVSHAFNEVVRLADHLVLIDSGRVLRAGALEDVASEAEIAPLIGGLDTGSVLRCTITAHDATAQLSTLSFGGGTLRVPLLDHPAGADVRLRIRARDVAIARERVEAITVANQLPAIITALTSHGGPYLDVALMCGSARLHALVTRESAVRLGLATGDSVFALIKTVTFDARAAGFARDARLRC
jgi:molybdate transport system ATP-binding protein